MWLIVVAGVELSKECKWVDIWYQNNFTSLLLYVVNFSLSIEFLEIWSFKKDRDFLDALYYADIFVNILSLDLQI